VAIDEIHIMGVTIAPPEEDSPSLVDPDPVLASAITGQLLETVAGWNAQV
jgi:hypothetical protein